MVVFAWELGSVQQSRKYWATEFYSILFRVRSNGAVFLISTKEPPYWLCFVSVCSSIGTVFSSSVPANERVFSVLVRFILGLSDFGNPLVRRSSDIHNVLDSGSISGGRWNKAHKCCHSMQSESHYVLNATIPDSAKKLLTANSTVFDCVIEMECFTTLNIGHMLIYISYESW